MINPKIQMMRLVQTSILPSDYGVDYTKLKFKSMTFENEQGELFDVYVPLENNFTQMTTDPDKPEIEKLRDAYYLTQIINSNKRVSLDEQVEGIVIESGPEVGIYQEVHSNGQVRYRNQETHKWISVKDAFMKISENQDIFYEKFLTKEFLDEVNRI